MTSVYLPLASRVLLTGVMPGGDPAEDEAVNIASVEGSRDFFVASEDGPRERAYFARLGREATLLDAAAASAIVWQLVERLLREGTGSSSQG